MSKRTQSAQAPLKKAEALKQFLPALKEAIDDIDFALAQNIVEQAPYVVIIDGPLRPPPAAIAADVAGNPIPFEIRPKVLCVKGEDGKNHFDWLDNKPLALDGCFMFDEAQADEVIVKLKGFPNPRKLHRRAFLEQRLAELRGLRDELTKKPA